MAIQNGFCYREVLTHSRKNIEVCDFVLPRKNMIKKAYWDIPFFTHITFCICEVQKCFGFIKRYSLIKAMYQRWHVIRSQFAMQSLCSLCPLFLFFVQKKKSEIVCPANSWKANRGRVRQEHEQHKLSNI